MKALLLVLFIFADLSYSFVQHLQQPLDGDMAWNIVPSYKVTPVLSDPLGLQAIVHGKIYSNPNRFFSHWCYRTYFLHVPTFLQYFVSPINSVYLAAAIFKTVLQVGLLAILSVIITGTKKLWSVNFILAAALLTPLLQTNGYRSYMGIVDPSITYTFFYAFPLALLLLYLLPFIQEFFHHKKPRQSHLLKLGSLLLALIVSLSGPLNPGISLVLVATIILQFIIKGQNRTRVTSRINFPINYFLYLGPLVVFSLYSLWLGSFNIITIHSQNSLISMYASLPKGLYLLFQKIGVPLLLSILILNKVLLADFKENTLAKKISKTYWWVGLFALVYILLLPLGGYRDYRPFIIRYDTFMPVTVSLFLLYGVSTLFLIKHLHQKQKNWYYTVLIVVSLIYMMADKQNLNKNSCEKMALKQISESQENTVVLNVGCTVLSWEPVKDSEESRLNMQLLKIWNIADRPSNYYQEKSDTN